MMLWLGLIIVAVIVLLLVKKGGCGCCSGKDKSEGQNPK